MADLQASLYLRLRGSLVRDARRNSAALERLGRHGKRSFERITRSAKRATAAIRRHGQAATKGILRSTTGKFAAALGAGAAISKAIKREDQAAYLQAVSGKSKEEIKKVFDLITERAKQTGLGIDKQFEVAKTLQDQGGLLDVFAKNHDLIGDVVQGTGGNPADIGALISVLKQTVGADLPKALGVLVGQAQKGNVTLGKLALVAPESLGAYKLGTGRTPEQTVAEVGALLQRAQVAVGSPEKGATGVRNLITALTNYSNKRYLQNVAGIKVQQNDKTTVNLLDILEGLKAYIGGDERKRARVFDRLGIDVESAGVLKDLLSGGLDAAKALAVTKGNPALIKTQAKAIQATKSATAVRALASAEAVSNPVVHKITEVVAQGAKRIEGAVQVKRIKKGVSRQANHTAQHFLQTTTPEQINSPDGQLLIEKLLKDQVHLSAEMVKQLKALRKDANQPLTPTLNTGSITQ